MWERGVEKKILPTLRELGIGFVAYSPIGRGFLGGKINTTTAFDKTDSRASHPRFQGENLKHNLQLVKDITNIANKVGATAPQVALAWLLRQGSDIVPIPGTKRLSYLEENVAAEGLELKPEIWSEIENILKTFTTAGTRYAESMMKLIDTSGA
jgi:aryl-alcohol dehydrogenase-like predicted oxidoreductase